MDIVCIGGINIDYFFPKDQATPLSMAGGVAYNIARNLRDCGNNIKLISIVGLDQNGLALINDMEKNGIDSRLVVKADHQKTASIDFAINEQGIVASSMINTDIYAALTPKNIKPLLDKISHIKTWIIDTDLKVETLCFIAQNKPKTCSLYAVIADPVKTKRIEPLLPFLSGLFLNQLEALVLMSNDLSNSSPLDIAEQIQKRGPHLVCLTLGEDGVAVSTHDTRKIYPAIKEQAISNTPFHGAGDAFASGVIDAILHESSMDLAIEKGLSLAKSVNQKHPQIQRSINHG